MLEVMAQKDRPGTPGQVAIDRLADFDAAIELAPREGLVSVTALQDPGSATALGLEGKRLLVIRNRMYLLGYLKRDSEQPGYDPLLRKAVRRFQADAGLTVDGWLGDQTWQALQALVSFETPTVVTDWLAPDTGRLCPALRRAIRLRLSVFGLMSRSANVSGISAALARFHEVLVHLGISDPALPEPGEHDLIALLFDQDELSLRLSTIEDTGRHLARSYEPKGGMWGEAANFITNMTKVELWLGGYDVKLETVDYGLVDDFTNDTCLFWVDLDLQKQVRRFWTNSADEGEDSVKFSARRKRRVKYYFLDDAGHFFREIADNNESLDDIEDDKQHTAIMDFYDKRPDAVGVTVEHVKGEKSFGARMWDGAKRVWGWIKRAVKAVIAFARRVIQFAQDIASAAHRFASEVFGGIYRAVHLLASSTVNVLSRMWPGSEAETTAIARDGDFDYRMVLNPAAPNEAGASVRRYNSETKVFSICCSIIGLVAGFVLRAFRHTVLSGGLALVFALIDAYSTVRQIVAEIRKLPIPSA